MRNDLWNLENEWLNEFAEAFVRDTHRLVRDVAIDTEEDCVVIRGCARSYYAAQLAIRCVQTLHRDRSLLPLTRLSLKVNDNPIELHFTHTGHPMQVADASTQMTNRRRELTLA